MTNFQWALMEASVAKVISWAKCPENKMIINYNSFGSDKIMSVLFDGVSHHNDKWEIVSGGFHCEDKLEIPFTGPEGYRDR